MGAVAIFMALSGFLMTYITRADADAFMLKRLVRIVPLYWALTVFYAFYFCFGLNDINVVFPQFVANPAGFLASNWHGVVASGELGRVLASMFFVRQFPIIGTGWTLNIEIFLYLVFSAALFISRTGAPFIAGIILVLCSMICMALPGLAIYSANIMYFAYGIGAYFVWAYAPKIKSKNIAVICLIFCALAFLTAPYFRAEIQILPVGVLLCALALHSLDFRVSWPPVVLLGDASYALYLIHELIMETIRPLGPKYPLLDFKNHISGVVILLVISQIVAVAVHLWIERPLIKLARAVLFYKRAKTTEVVGEPETALNSAPVR
jgi:exopolysaccharide production protein ExoZ